MQGIGYFQNLGNSLRNCLGIFLEDFFEEFFFEEFFLRIFLGGFFWGGNFLGGILCLNC